VDDIQGAQISTGLKRHIFFISVFTFSIKYNRMYRRIVLSRNRKDNDEITPLRAKMENADIEKDFSKSVRLNRDVTTQSSLSYQSMSKGVGQLNSENTENVMQEIIIDGTSDIVGPNGENIQNTNDANSANIRVQRGVVTDVAGAAARGICGSCMDKILMVVSTVLGVLVGGGLLAYQGTQASIGFNYVLWAFAGIEFIAGIYIIFRTFSLASAMAEFEETQEKLQADVAALGVEYNKLQGGIDELKDTNEQLQSVNTQLLNATNDLRAENAKLDEQCTNVKAVVVELSNVEMKKHINALRDSN
jgi:FtsZ-binding cell division protein ZapB